MSDLSNTYLLDEIKGKKSEPETLFSGITSNRHTQSAVISRDYDTKRPPIKYGYLFKQSSGKWKRRRWSQRWFVLDYEAGTLKYFRHASLPEAVPFRQDGHGVILLKEKGALFMIQGDLPRGVPTPFCFTISDENKEFRICADSSQEFKEWSHAISAVMGPHRRDENGRASRPEIFLSTNIPNRSCGLNALKKGLEINSCSTILSSRIPGRATIDGKAFLHDKMAVLILLNPLIIILRVAHVEIVATLVFVLNVLLVWILWFHNSKPSSNSSDIASRSESTFFLSKQTAKEVIEVKFPSVQGQAPKILGEVDGQKVFAGSSLQSCACDPLEMIPRCWSQLDATRFNVRQGPNYRKNKVKAASDTAVLKLIATDVFRSERKIDNIGSIVDIKKLKEDDLFIVNCQVPCYPPSNPLWGEKQGDGEGFNFITYFAIPESVRKALNETEPSEPHIRLLKNFMQEASTVRDRFKAIGIVVNPQEQKLGRAERHLLETYNGQPILTRPQHRFYRGQGYFEVDVDAHEFNYVARKGLIGVSEHFPNMIVDFGFVLEGQEDVELPERILGSVRLCRVDPNEAPVVA